MTDLILFIFKLVQLLVLKQHAFEAHDFNVWTLDWVFDSGICFCHALVVHSDTVDVNMHGVVFTNPANRTVLALKNAFNDLNLKPFVTDMNQVCSEILK